jgi:hypothetical protein
MSSKSEKIVNVAETKVSSNLYVDGNDLIQQVLLEGKLPLTCMICGSKVPMDRPESHNCPPFQRGPLFHKIEEICKLRTRLDEDKKARREKRKK